MTDPTPPPDRPETEEEEPIFVGTLFVMMVLIILTAGMWAVAYFNFLGR